MKIEASLAAKKRIAAACELRHLVKVKNGETKIAKKKSCERTQSCHVVPKKAIQILFDTCKEVFRGPGTVPLRLDVRKLRFVLGYVWDPENLTSNWQFALFELENSYNDAICTQKDDNIQDEEGSSPRLKAWKTILLVEDR